MAEEPPALEKLEKAIGYSFSNRELLLQSLTHPSCFHQRPETGGDNQRLEFLGDALLSAILAEKLYRLLPDKQEGILSRSRSAIVKGRALAELARKIGLGPHIHMSPAEKKSGGQGRLSTLEDTLEALVGAVYLDSDWETARRVVLGWYGDFDQFLSQHLLRFNPKGRLQELAQATVGARAVRYKLVENSGPEHKKHYRVQIIVSGKVLGEGEGPSKKRAEEKAARKALQNWAPEA